MQTEGKQQRAPSAYKLIWNLKRDEAIELPYEKWNAARSAASVFKIKYDRIYRVNKQNRRRGAGSVIVIRIK